MPSSSDPSHLLCASCGEAIEDGALFCGHCGEPIQYRAPDVDPFIGRMVSQHYKIVQRVARGGMGEVYLARHEELNQRVAVKFLHRRFADDEELAARFFNEAMSACKVRHPLAVSIYDFGRLDDGTLYIVMEYVEGVSLAVLIRQEHRLAPSLAVRIARQACEVLADAHGQNVVHRDIKPDNIMVMGPSERRSIKVLDFGIAKILDEDTGGLTQTGMMFGTPEYMSPEQASGDPLDHRSDVYQLGIVLFEMLVGHPPFRGQNKLALLQRHIRETPTPLDKACPTALPGPIVDLVRRMLSKRPDDRPQTMDAVFEELGEIEPLVSDRAVRTDRPAAGASGAGSRIATEGRILSHQRDPAAASAPVSHAFGPELDAPATDAYEMGAAPAGVSDDAYALGDGSAPLTDEYSLGGGQDFSFDDDSPYTPQPRRRVSGGGRGGPIFVAAVIALALIGGLASMWVNRDGTTTPDTEPASADASDANPDAAAPPLADGSGAEGSGQARRDEAASAPPAEAATPPAATPPPAEPAPRPSSPEPRVAAVDWDAALAPARTALTAGDVASARATLDEVAARQGGDRAPAVRALRDELDLVVSLQRDADRFLATGECMRADERVVALGTHGSRLATAYYAALNACRAAAEPEPPAAPAAAPTPAPTPAPPPRSAPRERGPVMPPPEL